MKKLSIVFIAFLQALGLTLYASLIGIFFWKGARYFGPMNNFLGPIFMLLLLVISVIICALIFGYYPFILWWEEKQTKKAIELVLYTTLWLAILIFLVLVGVLLFP